MKKRSHEHELPEGYEEILSVDAKEKKFAIGMNVAAIVIAFITVLIAYMIIRPTDFIGNNSIARNLIFMVTLIVYIVLHEITHGIAYKLLTHEKLTFGVTLSVAYCGVPNIYVYRRTALIALLSPFVVFTIIFGAAVFILQGPWDKMYAAIVLGIHLGGCSGDLYDTFLFMTRLKSRDILMNDTGPKQTFYRRLS